MACSNQTSITVSIDPNILAVDRLCANGNVLINDIPNYGLKKNDIITHLNNREIASKTSFHDIIRDVLRACRRKPYYTVQVVRPMEEEGTNNQRSQSLQAQPATKQEINREILP